MPRGHELAQPIAYSLQLAVGTVFLLSVVPKLRSPGSFAATVARYELLRPALASPVAVAVVAVEGFLAISLLTGLLIQAALPLAVLILLVFAGALTINLRRGRDVACGCFGGSAERISVRGLVRVLLLLLATCVLAVMLRSDAVELTTVATLADGGAAAAEYVLHMTTFAAFLLIAGVWLLSAVELRSLLRRDRP